MSVKRFLIDPCLLRITNINNTMMICCALQIPHNKWHESNWPGSQSYESRWSPRCTESVRDWSWRVFLLFISRLWFPLPACWECPLNKWRMPDLTITSPGFDRTKTQTLLLSQENSNYENCLIKRTIFFLTCNYNVIPWSYIYASVCKPLVVMVVVVCCFS